MNKEINGENLERFRENGKEGYKDKETGEVVIGAIYDDVWNFSEGLAIVELNDKFGFIDATGKVVVEIKYDYAGSKNGFIYVKLDGKFGFVKNGKVQELKYDYIDHEHDDWEFNDCEIVVELEEQLYIINSETFEQLPFYTGIDFESNGDENGHIVFDFFGEYELKINEKGKIFPIKYECYFCGKKTNDKNDLILCYCNKLICDNCFTCKVSDNVYCSNCCWKVRDYMVELVYMQPCASGNIDGKNYYHLSIWGIGRDGDNNGEIDSETGEGDLSFSSNRNPASIKGFSNENNHLLITGDTEYLEVSEYFKKISCDGCGIKELNLKSIRGLVELLCSGNVLRNLEVGSVKLKTLDCSNNNIDKGALNDLFESLHSETIEGKTVTITGNPGAAACDRSIAEKKGWTVIG